MLLILSSPSSSSGMRLVVWMAAVLGVAGGVHGGGGGGASVWFPSLEWAKHHPILKLFMTTNDSTPTTSSCCAAATMTPTTTTTITTSTTTPSPPAAQPEQIRLQAPYFTPYPQQQQQQQPPVPQQQQVELTYPLLPPPTQHQYQYHHQHHHQQQPPYHLPVMTRQNLFMAGGKIVPALRQLWILIQNARFIGQQLLHILHLGDLALLMILGWFTVPLLGIVYRQFGSASRLRSREHYTDKNGHSGGSTMNTTTSPTRQQRQHNSSSSASSASSPSGSQPQSFPFGGNGHQHFVGGSFHPNYANHFGTKDWKQIHTNTNNPAGARNNHNHDHHYHNDDNSDTTTPGACYEMSYVFLIAHHIQQAARLGVVVYLVDCLTVFIRLLGLFNTNNTQHAQYWHGMSRALCKIVYLAWAAQRISVLKRYYLSRAVSRKPDRLGRFTVLDRLLDGVLVFAFVSILLDILDVEMGVAVTSMFAFGSAWTLVLGLASKDLATMFVSGLTLSTSDRVQEGDNVRFGDGTSGKILQLGWMHTVIRHYDDTVEIIPNSQLGMQRVINYSRVKQCRVMQTLRFRYDDADKLPDVLQEILDEIKLSCPELVTDGSRPYRAVWTDFKEDYLQVMIDVHFHLPSMGTKYWNNRMKVMQAIHRAVRKHHVQFVTTFYPSNMTVMNKNTNYTA